MTEALATQTPAPPVRADHELPTFGGGAVAVLGGSVPVDGRLSWYASEHLGRHVPFNSYLLRQGDEGLLLESGVPAVAAEIASQLRDHLGSHGRTPRLAVTRNEPDCVANIPNLVRTFGLEKVHSPGLMNTLQFFPDPEQAFGHSTTELQMLNFGVSCAPVVPGGEVVVAAGRVLDVMAAPLRVLPSVWYYDRAARTLFCSDSFSDETGATPMQRFVSDVDSKPVLIDRFRRHIPGKFDWLPRSDLSGVIADLEAIFARFDIENLAPTRGLVIRGGAAVAAKIDAVMTVLKAL